MNSETTKETNNDKDNTPAGMTTPCSFVIFGASGDLASNKLLPALYQLQKADKLPEDLQFLALGRHDWSREQWHQHTEDTLKNHLQSAHGQSLDKQVLQALNQRFDYLCGDYAEAEHYHDIKQRLGNNGVQASPEAQPSSSQTSSSTPAQQHKRVKCENIVFYLAIRPNDYLKVVNQLHLAGLSGAHSKHRIVIEKPFGEDLDSAKMLNQRLHEHFDEEQIFRIDHYLGKETVQNLMVFRFANSLIEPIWNRNYIDQVQITVAEQYGIGSRANYFDSAGALRDMVQNHLMQLLTLTAMEPPPSLDANALQDEKVKVLKSIRPIPKKAVHAYAFRAQYGAGQADGKPVPGYQDENGVSENSTTETYVAAKFYVDNWRWKGVPFYLRTGKRMKEKMSSICIRLKPPPQQLFRETPLERIEPNWIVLSLYPHECMHIEMQAKRPGLEMDTRTVKLHAPYRDDSEPGLDAYDTLLLDVIHGDRSLFIRFDEVEWAWRVVDPILRHWALDDDFIHSYPAGSWGPDESSRLFDDEDHCWRNKV
jgi:glucose-6-phosphate 1-dehydrogenase